MGRRRTLVSQQTISAKAGDAHTSSSAAHGAQRLGALLCWAVVFADIGTSVYYVPGILFNQFGHLAGLFVTLTLLAFVLLALKYAEVSVRFPEGGGVVTVSARALNKWVGALGGMFILVDYFLTAAISSLSGLQYLQDVFPPIKPLVLTATIIVLVLLGVLNWWGIKESATVSLYIAIAAFISDLVVIVAILATVPLVEILHLVASIFSGSELTPVAVLTGFAGAFLAFSGLESISQLSPVMLRPRNRTVTIALSLVVITVGFTSPLLTILSTTLLDGKHNYLLAHPVATIDPNQFISQLGAAAAGPIIGVATAVIASALLIFASNTAIIGSYHVFLALSRMSFFPRIVETRDAIRDTPIISIALATGIPIAILLFARGQIDLLGQLYAFGLLGAFSLTSISLDALRFRERRGGKQVTLHEEELEAEAEEDARIALAAGRPLPPSAHDHLNEDSDKLAAIPVATAPQTGRERALALWWMYWRRYWPTINFDLGLVTSVLVLTAWITNLIAKRDATIFGSSLTVVGMAIAIWHYRWRTRSGDNVLQPSWALSASPDSVFAITYSGSLNNAQVIESAFNAARGRKVLVIFLSSRILPTPRIMQISDPALRDEEAQATFRLAHRLSQQTGVPTQVYYRIGAAASAAALWRVARSPEVVADATTAHAFMQRVAPTYVRYRRQGGASIVHIILKTRESAPATTPPSASATQATELPTPIRAGGAARAPLFPIDDDLGDEVLSGSDLNTLDESYPGASGSFRAPTVGESGVRPGGAASPAQPASPGERPVPHPERPRSDDTRPRYPVKLMRSTPPSHIVIAPRPAPKSRSSTRMSESMPIESDEDALAMWSEVEGQEEPPSEGNAGKGRDKPRP